MFVNPGRLVCLPIALLLASTWAIAPDAGAATPPAFLSPVTLSAQNDVAGPPKVAVDGDGDAVAVWVASSDAGSVVQAASRPAGGSWTAPVDIGTRVPAVRSQDVDVALSDDGDAIAVWNGATNESPGPKVATLSRGGAWSAPGDLGAADDATFGVRVAMSPKGHAVTVWSGFGTGTGVIRARTRGPAGSWAAVRDVSDPATTSVDPDVDISAGGDATAVWSTFGTVQSASRPRGEAWTEARQLSELEGIGLSNLHPRVAVSPKGDVVAGWSRNNDKSAVIDAVSRSAHGEWSAPVQVSDGGGLSDQLGLAISDRGGAVAVWIRQAFGLGPVEAARLRDDGSWSSPRSLSDGPISPAGASIAAARNGDAVAIWGDQDISGPAVRAARLHGSAWSAAVDIARGTAGTFPYFVSGRGIGMSDSGDAVAVWQQSTEGGSVVQAAATG